MLEETLEGEELSFIILTDGERYAALVPTRDHKRVFDGNAGPNTGGMGAYSSDELLPERLARHDCDENCGADFAWAGGGRDSLPGISVYGVMLTKSGPKVLEFNCRLGDPETQAIVARMDFDLAEVLADVAARRAGRGEIEMEGWSECLRGDGFGRVSGEI